jgi:hypothetical protein
MFVVPGEDIGIGPLASIGRWLNLLAMEGIVVLAVVEFFPDATADLEAKVWGILGR